jgi:predicted  nucleic acid-binding Zn-ribbon protein
MKLDKKLEGILMIQSIDIRFDEIKREKEESPKEIEKLKEDLDLLKNAMEQDLSTLEEQKKRRRTVERELEEIELKFQKSKARLNDVKSNKEYQAVLKEIEELKGLTFQKEEVVIKCMEDIEIQEKECADNNVNRKESEKEYKSREEEFSKKMRDLDKEVKFLNEKRIHLCKDVDKDFLERYDRLKKHLKGRVVAQVIDAICQGCNLGIPPQQYNELIRGGSIISCPNCSRIIYWVDDKEI